MFTLMF